MQVILKEEQLAPGFNAEEVAGLTDGYSGSDLKNLCIAAAYRPIRDFLAAENAAGKHRPHLSSHNFLFSF